MTDSAVLLIAHGSRRRQANQELFDLAERLREQAGFRLVQPSFLELARPDIAEGGRLCVASGARVVLMIPYFLSTGVHLSRDLAAARDQLAEEHPGVAFLLGSALGPHPLLDELVRLRIAETEGNRTLPADPH